MNEPLRPGPLTGTRTTTSRLRTAALNKRYKKRTVERDR
jgi:hypothetical protein